MTISARLGLMAATAALCAASGAAAQEFSGAQAVAIDDAIALVRIEFKDSGPVSVDIDNRGERPLNARREGSRVVVSGAEDLEKDVFWRLYDGETEGGIRIGRLRIAGTGRSISMENGENQAFNDMLENYPEVVIRAPRGTDLTLDGSALRLRADGEAGEVRIEDTIYVIADLGDARRALVTVSGPGRVGLGDIEDELRGMVDGSGDLTFGRAGTARLDIDGSGDIEGGEVSGEAEASVDGSGDIAVSHFRGGLKARVDGSGDIETDSVTGPLSASVDGSGDIGVGRVDGPVEASVNGSGDIDLGRGEAPSFSASVNGSGDVVFRGTAFDPSARTSGSGDISIGKAEGKVEASGQGITIGGRRYKENG